MSQQTASAHPQRRLSLIGRAIGFSAVSVGAVAVTQTVLLVTYAGLDWPAVAANITAVCVAAAPAYLANRRWVWSRRAGHSWLREIIPFWAYNLAGLGISTLLVALADRWWGSPAAVSIANIVAFGALWAGKFGLLECVLFAGPATAARRQ